MEELIRQIRAAKDAGLFYLALMGALLLVDICGALASENGRATGVKFKEWLRTNVPENAADAEILYGLRCSLLHQGSMYPHGAHPPVACTFPHPAVPQLHRVLTEVGGDQMAWLSIPIFVEEIIGGAEVWFSKYGASARVKRNMEKFARLRPEGLPPHVVGAPVIA